MDLAGKKIVVGMTGGIAAYKVCELVRRLQDHGADVTVVMTAAAQEFVTATTMQALSGRPVFTDAWRGTGAQAPDAMPHISLSRGAAAMVVARNCPLLIAPAMNVEMWSNPATQRNVHQLRADGVEFLGPATGDQACGEVGAGRMLEPTQLAGNVINAIAPTGPLAGKRVLLTAGPTRERIDPVRFISNRSSGKMGFALAAAAREAGADVTIVCGPVALATPAGVKRIDVESAADMLNAVMKNIDGVDIFVATAAVADYRPASPVECKIKKTSESMDLKMERTVDILATVAARAGNARPFVVGFAAETDSVEQYARQKLLKKNLDMIAANEVGHDKVFEKDDNALLVLWREGRRELPQAPKISLARDLIALVAERYAERKASPRLTSVSA